MVYLFRLQTKEDPKKYPAIFAEDRRVFRVGLGAEAGQRGRAAGMAVAFWRANGGLLGERSPEGFYAYWKAVFAADMGQETKASEKGSSGRAEEKTNKGGREDCNSWGRYDQNALDFGSVEEHPSWKAADEAKRN